MKRRHFNLVLAALASGAGSGAEAQAVQRKYATMSLVGNMLIAVERAVQVGSRVSQNVQTEIKVNGDIVDRAALGAISDLIAKAEPMAKAPLPLLIDEPVLYEQQARLFDGKFVRLPLNVVKAAKDGGATHMLLLTKQRANLSFRFTVGGRSGVGAASGLGFYIDPDIGVGDLGNNQQTSGFLGLYVHIRATVVELGTELIMSDRNIVATELYINTREGFGGLPWDALPPTQKVRAVAELLLRSLRDEVPALLKA